MPSALQRRVKGTGLGLPLCRKLASLLGGEVSLGERARQQGSGLLSTRAGRQVPGRSTVMALPPLRERIRRRPLLPLESDWSPGGRGRTRPRACSLREVSCARAPSFRAVAMSVPRARRARSPRDAAARSAVILDIHAPRRRAATAWRWRGRHSRPPMRFDPGDRGERNRATSRKAYLLGRRRPFLEKPVSRDAVARQALREGPQPAHEPARSALIIDDDPAARYVIRRSVRAPMRFEEASDGNAGLAAATRHAARSDPPRPADAGRSATASEVLETPQGATRRPRAIPRGGRRDPHDDRRQFAHRAFGIPARARSCSKKDISIETLARALDVDQRVLPRSREAQPLILNVDDNDAGALREEARILAAARASEVHRGGQRREGAARCSSEQSLPTWCCSMLKLPDMNGREPLRSRSRSVQADRARSWCCRPRRHHMDLARPASPPSTPARTATSWTPDGARGAGGARAGAAAHAAGRARAPERAIAALREADRRKDEFLAMLAHELRNPLAPIRNAVEILRLSPDRAVRERARELIVGQQVNHLVPPRGRPARGLAHITQRKVVLQPRRGAALST